MLKRFVALLIAASALLTFSGLAFAQFLEENYLSARGITFNLPSGYLLTIASGEFLIASSAGSLEAYLRRQPVEEGIVISIAFPQELAEIGLTADTPPLEAAEAFAGLVGATDIVEYDTTYGPYESVEAYSFTALGDSLVIFFDVEGLTVAFRVAGEYELFSSVVNGLIASMELDDDGEEEEASAPPFMKRTALTAFAGAQ